MENRCFACHGELGGGGAGPKFRGDPFLMFSDYVVQILLGRNIMPGFASKLGDQDIAAVASYIRNSWGNRFGEVKAEQVARTRQELKLAGEPAGTPGQSAQNQVITHPPD